MHPERVILPYPNFAASAFVWDGATLHQTRDWLGELVEMSTTGEVGCWYAPGAKAWVGYLPALALLWSVVVRECRRRGGYASLLEPYDVWGRRDYRFWRSPGIPPSATEDSVTPPAWLGNEELHASHRSWLLGVNPQHYDQFGWTEKPGQDPMWEIDVVQASSM